MGKSTKNQHLRERTRAAVKQSKQSTLDSLPDKPKKEFAKAPEFEHKKQIIITEIGTVTKEDELALEVEFRLLPSKAAFSKVTSDLYFDDQKLNSACISIPQSPLATNEFTLTPVLDMKGISAGSHTIKVEMYELWSSGEKLTCSSKEVAVNYVPINKEDRLIRVPIVKSIAGTDIAVVLDADKGIYREIEETAKKEVVSKRDEW